MPTGVPLWTPSVFSALAKRTTSRWSSAKLIARRLAGDVSPAESFRYWDKGMMATIGAAKAVAQSGGMRISGFVAWLVWLFIHILYLARFENRVLVLWQWFFNYVTRNRAARLITGEGALRTADPTRGVPPGEKVVKG